MNSRAEGLLKEARQLSAEDRAELASAILDSISPMPPDVTHAWASEIEARLKAFDDGSAKAEPATDVLRQARDRIPR